jgi:hypothetical protein
MLFVNGGLHELVMTNKCMRHKVSLLAHDSSSRIVTAAVQTLYLITNKFVKK